MDLALNNLQSLICHINPTNQLANRSQEINKPFISETTESACVLYFCMYCITVVIDLIMAIKQHIHL